MRQKFSTFDIVKSLGIERECLREWMKLGYIKPTYPSRGKGNRAVFLRDSVYRVALFRHLLDAGFTRKGAAGHINDLINFDGDYKNTVFIIVNFEKVAHEVDQALDNLGSSGVAGW